MIKSPSEYRKRGNSRTLNRKIINIHKTFFEIKCFQRQTHQRDTHQYYPVYVHFVSSIFSHLVLNVGQCHTSEQARRNWAFHFHENVCGIF